MQKISTRLLSPPSAQVRQPLHGDAAPRVPGGAVLDSITSGRPSRPSPTVPTAVALAPPGSARSPASSTATVASAEGGDSAASPLGRALAATAKRIAGGRNTVGNCYASVADAIDAVVGRFLYGMSAYMAADQLARHPRFREITAGGEQLRQLPPGAVVVWGRTSRSPDGHISVALGDGREASDHIEPQRSSLRGDYRPRVFLPR